MNFNGERMRIVGWIEVVYACACVCVLPVIFGGLQEVEDLEMDDVDVWGGKNEIQKNERHRIECSDNVCQV